MLQAGLAIVAGAAIADQAMAQDAQKIDKKLVMYQEQPKDGQHCAICAQFMPPNACKIVAGEINPNGWCAAFAPKA
ncbi:MAG: high-potential iron-sulfur protein [Proteobacteria bacterium]|nr:high-potential iron-sulfur protein [Pseudomonadota bacterium]